MDFNQDGVKELVIRRCQEGVNNTASFCYDKGHIKMWGSYISADYHGYELPLANGKILSVSWYQDNKDWWIKRLDIQGNEIKEGCYSMREVLESPDGDGMGTGQEAWGGGETEAGANEKERKFHYEFQDYYCDGSLCGAPLCLSEEEWKQMEDWIEGLQIPEDVWKPCSVFTPRKDRPAVPDVG